jgi:hypothetical protein
VKKTAAVLLALSFSLLVAGPTAAHAITDSAQHNVQHNSAKSRKAYLKNQKKQQKKMRKQQKKDRKTLEKGHSANH